MVDHRGTTISSLTNPESNQVKIIPILLKKATTFCIKFTIDQCNHFFQMELIH